MDALLEFRAGLRALALRPAEEEAEALVAEIERLDEVLCGRLRALGVRLS
jgi:hypothetical protein